MTTQTTKPDLSKLRINEKQIPSSHSRTKPLITFLRVIFPLSLVILLAWAIFKPGVLQQNNPPQSPPVTTTATAQPSALPRSLNATGYVVAQRQAAVSSKATGRIKELRVKEGDIVEAEQILAVLENEDLVQLVEKQRAGLDAMKTRVQFAEAERNVAELELKRIASLLPKGAASTADYEAAEARFRRARADLAMQNANVVFAEAGLKEAQVNLDYSTIRAPFAGTVLTKNADIGEIVAPFGSSSDARAAVVTIADMSSLQVEADVSEANIAKVSIGQSCKIVLDSFPEKTYLGIVDSIVPTVDRAKATVLVKIRFIEKDQSVIPEMSAKVEFDLTAKNE